MRKPSIPTSDAVGASRTKADASTNAALTVRGEPVAIEAMPVGGLTAERRRQLGRRAQLLAAASVGYNLIECIVAVAVGAAVSSIALVGFGLDSLVEVGSGLVILWQFRHVMPETRERQALRYIGVSFFALAAYVTFESVRSLTGSAEPEPSPLGIGIAAVSLVIMPFLSWAQRRTGRELGSGSVVADSKQTLLCTYLSAVLLLGLLANAIMGWSWADPIAGLIIATVAVREGLEAWRGESCDCAPTSLAHADRTSDDATDKKEPGSKSSSSEDGCDDGCCQPARPLPPAPQDGHAPRP